MALGSWGTLRGAIVPVVICPPIYLQLVPLSARLLDAMTCVAVAVDDLSCISGLLMPGHKVVCCPSKNGLDGFPILVDGEELAKFD